MTLLRGRDLKGAFSASVMALESWRETINGLNVFPVPDGDTGTNMLLTLRAAVENVPESSEITAGALLEALADGAFEGARGNSGVIFSQFLAGMSAAIKSTEECHEANLGHAFSLGAAKAYESVGRPVDGTMLTVFQSLAPAVALYIDQGENDPTTLWEAAFNASNEALTKTPDQLAVLKDAGVVDAGAMGVVVILGAALEYLSGKAYLDELPDSLGAGGNPCTDNFGTDGHQIDPNHLIDSLSIEWGYCIQFMVQTQDKQGLDLGKIRGRLGSSESGSAVVAGSEKSALVHVHASNPATVLSYCSSLGSLHQVIVQSMDHQNHRFVTDKTNGVGPTSDVAVIAVATGDGLSGLFLKTGCADVVSGGETMNPSVKDLLDSVRTAGAASTILLPNNSNVVAAARQAAAGNPNIHVAPSRSIPQGIAALLAFLPHLTLEENLSAMKGALASVKSIDVTRAVRDTAIDSVKVESGQYIGLLDNQLVSTANTPDGALWRTLDTASLSEKSLVTVYVGADGGWREAEELAEGFQGQIDGLQVEVVYGGQPHHHYLASVE